MHIRVSAESYFVKNRYNSQLFLQDIISLNWKKICSTELQYQLGHMITWSLEIHVAAYNCSISLQEIISLHVYSLNGKKICSTTLQHQLGHMIIKGDYLITGDSHGSISVLEIFGWVHFWFSVLKHLPTSVDISWLQMEFANNMGPNQVWHVRPDLDPNCLTKCNSVPERTFWKKMLIKRTCRWNKIIAGKNTQHS